VAELARLEGAMADAGAGRPRVVLIGGEAGVGKTRLLEEALDGWRARALILEGACVRLGPASPPYAPVVGLLRSLRRQAEPGQLAAILGPGRGLLGRLVPDLVERAADLPSEPVDPTSQIRLFELVAGAVERLARRGSLVVAVEDIHWADASSRALLDFLVRGVQPGERLLLVATVRTDAAEAEHEEIRVWAAELMRVRLVERVDLGPLGRAEVASIVADVLGRPPGPQLVDRVVERANGNAFLTEELAAAGDRLASDGPDAVPDRLREILVSRLATVLPATRAMLLAASAAGQRIDDELLAEVTGAAPADVDAALRDAIAHGIVVVDRSGATRFRHLLLRDAVASELLPGERRRLHHAYAVALERRAVGGREAPEPEALAYHWDAADRPDRAAPAHVDAARAAVGVYAWAEAAHAFERALELAASAPGALPDEVLPEMMIEAANASALQGAYGRAVAHARAAAVLVDPEREPARAAAIHERLRWFLWEAGDYEAAAAEVAEALRLAPASPPSVLRARAVVHAAGLALSTGDVAGALRLADEAITMARLAGGPSEEALGLAVVGLALASTGDVDGGAERFREGMAIARRLGAAEGLALGYANLTRVLDVAGRTAEALAEADAGFVEVERYGLARSFGVPLLTAAARMRFELGRWEEAEALLERARSLAPLPVARIGVEVAVARLEVARGRFDAARVALESARSAGRAGAGPAMAAVPLPGGGATALSSILAEIELAAWDGELEDVRRLMDAALHVPPADPEGDPDLVAILATAAAVEADAAAAASAAHDDRAVATAAARIRAIRGLVSTPDRSPVDERTGPADAAVLAPPVAYLRRQCRLELDRAAGPSDPMAWAALADAWAALGRRPAEAYARSRQGEAELATAGPVEGRLAAREALRSAASMCARIGAVPLLGSIERLARLARIDLRPTPASAGAGEEATGAPEPGTGRVTTRGASRGGAGSAEARSLGLTPRELEVLRLVAAGWSNPEIADELGISPKTASVHVSNLLAKLGVANRVEAAVAATRLGLVERG
jgi:DNA-binding CsgD family transcriptional regulator/tetratricopeptide (TPR) repeat protein